MSDNSQKTPFGAGLHQRNLAQILGHLQLMGGKAPAKIVKMDKTNTILTVQFLMDQTVYKLPNVTIPVHGPEYTRFPFKVGDMGAVAAFDFDTGNVNGLGASGLAAFTRPANLASLVFHPLGNLNFSPVDDPKAHQSYGDNGTIARDTNKKSQVKTHPTEGTSIQGGGDGSGNFPHSSTAGPDKVTHKSSASVTTDAPVHDVTGMQTVAGTGSFGGALSALGGLNLSGLISGASGSGGGGVSAASLGAGSAAENVGALGGDLTGMLPDPTVVGATGVPVYASQAAARAALGAWKLYINSTLGATSGGTYTGTSTPSGGGTGGTSTTTVPASPSFYAQGILVMCNTGA